MRTYGLSVEKKHSVLYKPLLIAIIAISILASWHAYMPEGVFSKGFFLGIYQAFSTLLVGNLVIRFIPKAKVVRWLGILFATQPNKSLGFLLSNLIAFAWLLTEVQSTKLTATVLTYVVLSFAAGTAIATFFYSLFGFKARDLAIIYQIETDRQDSFIAVIASAVFLGSTFSFLPTHSMPFDGNGGIIFPILLAIAGLLVTFIGAIIIGEKPKNNRTWLTVSIFSAVSMVLISTELVILYLPKYWTMLGKEYSSSDMLLAVQIGLLAGFIAGTSVKFYDSIASTYVKFVLDNSSKKIWLNIILRFFINIILPFAPIITITFALLISYGIGNLYGASISFLGMLSHVGLSLVVDTNRLNATKMRSVSFWQRQKLLLLSPDLQLTTKYLFRRLRKKS